MTYKQLEDLLYPLGLFIADRKWDITREGKVILEGKVSAKTLNDTPCFNEGASYGDIYGSGDSPDALAENIFDKMTNPENKILIGSYDDYHSIIEWSGSEGRFVKRKLTEIEAIEQNTSI